MVLATPSSPEFVLLPSEEPPAAAISTYSTDCSVGMSSLGMLAKGVARFGCTISSFKFCSSLTGTSWLVNKWLGYCIDFPLMPIGGNLPCFLILCLISFIWLYSLSIYDFWIMGFRWNNLFANALFSRSILSASCFLLKKFRLPRVSEPPLVV